MTYPADRQLRHCRRRLMRQKSPTIGGLIVREYNDSPSNFRYTKTLSEILEENGIPGIAGIDTRTPHPHASATTAAAAG